jgi:hypothetical protein
MIARALGAQISNPGSVFRHVVAANKHKHLSFLAASRKHILPNNISDNGGSPYASVGSGVAREIVLTNMRSDT